GAAATGGPLSVARTGRTETARRLASETFSELHNWMPLRQKKNGTTGHNPLYRFLSADALLRCQ
ncbi:hypothetical protein CMR03_05760, partial [Pantoea allii]|uniref:hypothetical protein n=1 Tax=Pantoea allii TaxID=574096 RepID=UPI000BD2FB8D